MLTKPPTLDHCPQSWAELEQWIHHALDPATVEMGQPLAIAFSLPTPSPPTTIWQHLVGVAKYLSRTATVITHPELSQLLGIGDRPLGLGLAALEAVGFGVEDCLDGLAVGFGQRSFLPGHRSAIQTFLDAIKEEQFQQQYFAQVPVEVLEEALKTDSLMVSQEMTQ